MVRARQKNVLAAAFVSFLQISYLKQRKASFSPIGKNDALLKKEVLLLIKQRTNNDSAEVLRRGPEKTQSVSTQNTNDWLSSLAKQQPTAQPPKGKD